MADRLVAGCCLPISYSCLWYLPVNSSSHSKPGFRLYSSWNGRRETTITSLEQYSWRVCLCLFAIFFNFLFLMGGRGGSERRVVWHMAHTASHQIYLLFNLQNKVRARGAWLDKNNNSKWILEWLFEIYGKCARQIQLVYLNEVKVTVS